MQQIAIFVVVIIFAMYVQMDFTLLMDNANLAKRIVQFAQIKYRTFKKLKKYKIFIIFNLF